MTDRPPHVLEALERVRASRAAGEEAAARMRARREAVERAGEEALLAALSDPGQAGECASLEDFEREADLRS